MPDKIQDGLTLLGFRTADGDRAVKDAETDETYIMSENDLTKCALALALTGCTAEHVTFEWFMIKSEEANGLAYQSYVKWEASQAASEATIN